MMFLQYRIAIRTFNFLREHLGLATRVSDKRDTYKRFIVNRIQKNTTELLWYISKASVVLVA